MKRFSFVMLAAVALIPGIVGCNLLNLPDVNPQPLPVDPDNPDPNPGPGPNPNPQPRPADQVSAEAIWSEIARHVAAQTVSNTDSVVNAANRLKDAGRLTESDLSRIDQLKKRRQEITSQNAAEIAAIIRGK